MTEQGNRKTGNAKIARPTRCFVSYYDIFTLEHETKRGGGPSNEVENPKPQGGVCMASITTTPGDLGTYRPSAISWGSIFAGCFIFLAIEVTFGLLGMAIFASAANPNAAAIGGMSVGAGIWVVVLSIIAMYFAGKTASRVSGTTTRTLGMYHGLVTFGMSIFATILVAALTVGSTVAGNATLSRFSNNTLASAISTSGWWIFFACLLGMIAASIGGSHGVNRELKAQVTTTPIDRERLRAA